MNTATHEREPPLLDIGDVAALLGISPRTVHRFRKAGKIPAPIKIRGTVRWNSDEIRRWVGAGCPPAVPAGGRKGGDA